MTGGYLGCSSASGLLSTSQTSSSENRGGNEAVGWKEGLLTAAGSWLARLGRQPCRHEAYGNSRRSLGLPQGF